MRRIAFGDFGALDVVSIEPLDDNGDMVSNAHLFMQPEIGITDIGNATDGSLTPLPGRVTLDPFVPYLEAYKLQYRAASAGRRRRLQEAKAQLQAAERSASARRALLADTFAALVSEPAQFASVMGGNASAGGRSLLQSSSLGCASNNKCPIKPTIFPGGGGYANQAVVFAVPACPVGFVVGPVGRPPCMYEISVSVSPTQVAVPLPIVITGALGVLLCNDLSSYEQIYANLALAGELAMAPPQRLRTLHCAACADNARTPRRSRRAWHSKGLAAGAVLVADCFRAAEPEQRRAGAAVQCRQQQQPRHP